MQAQFDNWKLELITEFHEAKAYLESELHRIYVLRGEDRRNEYDVYMFARMRELQRKVLQTELIINIEVPELKMEDFIDISEGHLVVMRANGIRVGGRKSEPKLVLRLPETKDYVRQRLGI